ncbi:MAG: GerMN domain-containing protein [Acidimicrobiales bacterium]
MSFDDGIRAALRANAERVEPGPDSWDRTQERVAAERRRRRARSRAVLGLTAAAVVVLVVGAVGVFGGDGSRLVETGPASTPTAPIEPDVPPPPADDDFGATNAIGGVWPFTTTAELEGYRAAGDTRYDDPVEVARSFAVEYLGMADPVVGGAQPVQGTDSAAAAEAGAVEVVLRSREEPGRPVPVVDTTLVLGPLGSDGSGPWNAMSASSPNIGVTRRAIAVPFGEPPEGFRHVTSPLLLNTPAVGPVHVEVRQAGMVAGEALGRSSVSGNGFQSSFPFDEPSTEGGAVVLFRESTVDGSVLEATVVDLSFDPNPVSEMPVTVFFTDEGQLTSGSETEVTPVSRQVPRTSGVLRAALEQLLAGPTDAEHAQGLRSFFSKETAGMLIDVTIGPDGTAVVDLGDLRPVIPNASTSAGSGQLLAQLEATVFQFATVSAVEYRIDGSCEAFWEWLQRSCQTVARPGS